MPGHVHAAKGECGVSFPLARFAQARRLRYSLRSQRVLDLAKREAVHDIILGQPAFARDADAEPQIPETLGAVRVGVDGAFNSFFLGARPPTPVEVEPFGRGVELDPGAG